MLHLSALSKDLYNLIWKPRCDITIQRQLSMGLSQRAKKIKYKNRSSSAVVPSSSRRVLRSSSLDQWSTWVHNSLVFGTSWLNFRRLLEYFQFPIVLFRQFSVFLQQGVKLRLRRTAYSYGGKLSAFILVLFRIYFTFMYFTFYFCCY